MVAVHSEVGGSSLEGENFGGRVSYSAVARNANISRIAFHLIWSTREGSASIDPGMMVSGGNNSLRAGDRNIRSLKIRKI